MHSLLITTLLCSLTASLTLAIRTIIPKSSLNSQSAFDTDWANLYPWGSDHNGAARMKNSKISLSGGVLTLTASPATGEKPASSGGKSIPIHYLSGTIHAKEHFTVAPSGGYDFTGDFKATTTKGTWPAFWLTAVDGWPPEIDLAEWKGSGKVSFNTFNTSKEVQARDVSYPSPGNWHTFKAELRDENGKDVAVRFLMDGKEVVRQVGKGFVGKGMWLIMDLQMEGSSGYPGPKEETLFQARNIEALSYNP